MPLTGRQARIASDGSPAGSVRSGHSAIRAASCPPAECPATARRSGSPPRTGGDFAQALRRGRDTVEQWLRMADLRGQPVADGGDDRWRQAKTGSDETDPTDVAVGPAAAMHVEHDRQWPRRTARTVERDPLVRRRAVALLRQHLDIGRVIAREAERPPGVGLGLGLGSGGCRGRSEHAPVHSFTPRTKPRETGETRDDITFQPGRPDDPQPPHRRLNAAAACAVSPRRRLSARPRRWPRRAA